MENKFNNIKAVIFDLDDTLISEKQYIDSGYRYISSILSVSLNIEKQDIYNLLWDLFEISPKNVFNRLLEKLKIPHTEEQIIKLVESYRNHEPKIQFYSDVLPCLEKLKEKNIKTGIITDGYLSTQRNKLRVLKADRYFDQIIITDEIGREYWKPHPKAFELMSQRLAVEFEEMLYIGDNPEKDFYISSIYPIKTIQICRKNEDIIHKDKSYFEDVKEDCKIYNLIDIINILIIGCLPNQHGIK